MSVKRALVVDDSKSARAYLVRQLERLDLEVDVAESADEALDYLELQHPDVIFLDHLMPGMDGFQGLQAIKRNPRTASIPVYMYTSQEGELYAGQALALGAAGVLPKQLETSDLERLMRDLEVAAQVTPAGLLARAAPIERPVATPALPPEGVSVAPRRPLRPPTVPPVTGTPPATQPPPIAVPPPPAIPVSMLADIAALRSEVADLRRLMTTGLEDQSRKLVADVVQAVGQVQPVPAVEHPPVTRDWRGTLYALLATAAAVVLAVLWLRGEVDRRSLEMQVAQLSASRTDLVAESPTASPAESKSQSGVRAGLPAQPVMVTVPYGEQPLSGARIDRLQELLVQLAATGFKGTVEVHVFSGRFCLRGSAAEGYALAADATPASRCEFAAAPAGDPARESPQFVAMVAEFRKLHGDVVTLSVTNGPTDSTVRPYPESGLAAATAAEWNAAAAQNSRVEVRWR
ncbi:MAG: hypothetical protein RLZZ200_1459 [Pseudomonadota bacterium]|jgi:CheY-like chemotaxis protein